MNIQFPLPPDVGAYFLLRACEIVRERALGGAGSGNFGHAGRPGEVGGSGDSGVPVEPGTTPIPDGMVRGYHFTDNLPSVLANGLDVAHAKGSTYGEPNGIWMSTVKPGDFKEYVEVFVKPDEIGLNGPDLWPKNSAGELKTKEDLQTELTAYNVGNHDFILRTGKIEPDRFVTYHEPWHDKYRYIAKDADLKRDILKGDHDWLLDNPEYGPAIKRIKAESKRSAGGSGSGNFGHSGRPGEIGGSGGISEVKGIDWSGLHWGREFTEPDDFYYHVTLAPQAARIVKAQELKPGNAQFMGRAEPDAHSTGRVFLTDRDGVFFWAERVEQHAADKFDNPPAIAVLRIPKSSVPNAQRDDAGTRDAGTPAYFVDGLVKLRSAGGSGSGNFGHAGRPGEIGGSGEGDVTDLKAFKTWFKDSKVVDGNGDPLVVYHGTTHDIKEFAEAGSAKLNPEADWGAGNYFTSSTEDMSVNYAGMGPDLTSRIEQRADQIDSEKDRGSADHEKSVEEAKQELLGHAAGGVGMPVYLSMQNPYVLGAEAGDSSAKETYLTNEFEYDNPDDPESDIVGSTGTLTDFTEALRENASEYQDTDGVDEFIANVQERGMEGMSASELDKMWRTDEKLGYITDDNGRLMSTELYRASLQDAGFDGVIDRTVYDKFGIGGNRKFGGGMQAMDADTVHYIAFRPTQIKSVFNRTFNPKNPLITAGGVGSGNFGHLGRPGEIGGSSSFGGLLDTIHEAGGGFTYNIVTKNQPTSGFMVATDKSTEKVLDVSRVTGVRLAQYVKDNYAKLQQHGNYLGAWHNPKNGKVYLDVTTRVRSHAKAERLGRTGKQIAYFDVGKLREVRIDYGKTRHAEETIVHDRGLGAERADSGGSRLTHETVDGESTDASGSRRDAQDSFRVSGGAGSGNFGHAGRPGEVGGSDDGAGNAEVLAQLTHRTTLAQAALDNVRDDLKSKNPDQDYREHPTYQAALTNLTNLRTQLLQAQHVQQEQADRRVSVVERRATEIATRMGVDPSIIHVVDKEPTPFTVGTQQFKEAGHFDPRDGQIEINARNSYDDRMSVTQGIAAHELQHAIFDMVSTQQVAEHDELRTMTNNHSPGGTAEYERLFFKHNGEPRPEAMEELAKRFPASAAFATTWGDTYLGTKQIPTNETPNGSYRDMRDVMVTEDGHSAYAKSYWAPEALQTRDGTRRAVNETLAEVTRYLVAPMSWGETDTPAPKSPWIQLAKSLHAAYPKIKKSRDEY